MAKEKMVLFRTSLGGFNREDVNNYIEKLNNELAEREKLAKKKLEAAEAKCRELADRIAELEATTAKVAELESEAQAREKLIAEYIEKVEPENVLDWEYTNNGTITKYIGASTEVIIPNFINGVRIKK